MQTGLAHIQFNVQPANLPFYQELMTFLGWHTIHAAECLFAASGKNHESFWFVGELKDVANDYDGPGVNHLAIGAESPADVDAVAAFLNERGVSLLFDTPRHRPEFSASDEHTYYQVMFETPDRLLFEVVYTGPKAV